MIKVSEFPSIVRKRRKHWSVFQETFSHGFLNHPRWKLRINLLVKTRALSLQMWLNCISECDLRLAAFSNQCFAIGQCALFIIVVMVPRNSHQSALTWRVRSKKKETRLSLPTVCQSTSSNSKTLLWMPGCFFFYSLNTRIRQRNLDRNCAKSMNALFPHDTVMFSGRIVSQGVIGLSRTVVSTALKALFVSGWLLVNGRLLKRRFPLKDLGALTWRFFGQGHSNHLENWGFFSTLHCFTLFHSLFYKATCFIFHSFRESCERHFPFSVPEIHAGFDQRLQSLS